MIIQPIDNCRQNLKGSAKKSRPVDPLDLSCAPDILYSMMTLNHPIASAISFHCSALRLPSIASSEVMVCLFVYSVDAAIVETERTLAFLRSTLSLYGCNK